MGSNPNSADADEWRNLVQKVLAVWSGYQLAVDFNSAGPETLERHKWFADVLTEHVYMTRGLKADDLDEWITSLLYHDFDLILEDDSVYPTSVFLVEAFSYLKNNNRERLDQLMATLPTEESVQQAKQASVRGPAQEDVEMDDISENMCDDDGDEDNDDDSEGPSQRERQPRTTTDDDGWTTILRR